MSEQVRQWKPRWGRMLALPRVWTTMTWACLIHGIDAGDWWKALNFQGELACLPQDQFEMLMPALIEIWGKK